MSKNIFLWLHGLGAAFISGGSGAITAGISVNLRDGKDWNFSDWPHAEHLLSLMAMIFVVNGALGAFGWLSKQPVPDLEGAQGQLAGRGLRRGNTVSA
jgi:hypothetical protein